MKRFQDNAGRTWTLSIDVAAIKRVRGRLGVDIPRLLDDGFKGLQALTGDVVQFVDVIFVLSTCSDPKASDEDFGRAMGGDALHAATEAFMEEFSDFLSDPKLRAALKSVMAKGKAVATRVIDRAAAEIEAIDVDAAATAMIARAMAAHTAANGPPATNGATAAATGSVQPTAPSPARTSGASSTSAPASSA